MSKNAKVTITSSTNGLENVGVNAELIIKKGTDRVFLAHEPTKEIGFISTEPFLLEGTVGAIEVEKAMTKDEYTVIVVEVSQMDIHSHKNMKSVVGEVLDLAVEEEEEEIVESTVERISVKLKGPTAKNPGKVAALASFQGGNETTVSILEQNGKLLAFFDNEHAGEVDAPKGDYTLLLNLIKNAVLQAVVTGSKASTVFVDVLLPETSIEAKLEAAMAHAMEIVGEEIVNDVKERFDDAAVDLETQIWAFESYTSYAPEYAALIPNVDRAIFVDTFEAMSTELAYMSMGSHLRLVGEKGTGKNVNTETLGYLLQRPVIDVGLSAQTDKMELTGSKTITYEEDGERVKQQITFDPEPFIKGAEIGALIVLDEVNAADPAVVIMIHGLLDSRRRMQVTGYKLVEAHPNFCSIATMNENYRGTKKLNEATKDRFVTIRFPHASSIADILKAKVSTAKKADIQLLDKIFEGLMDKARAGEISMSSVSTRQMVDALKVLPRIGVKRAIKASVIDFCDTEQDRQEVANLVELYL